MMKVQLAACGWRQFATTYTSNRPIRGLAASCQRQAASWFPMRIAYLDCFSGMSGDMFLGALVDAGVSPDLLERTVAALNLGAKLEISRVNRSGITATKVDVLVHGEKELPREEFWAQTEAEHRHSHDESHEHSHSHSREEGRKAVSAPHEHGHGRSLNEIREIIGRAAISEGARKKALEIFAALGMAEAKIHNHDIESVHFHEVGAVDAIVDIVGAAVGAEALDVDEIVCSPLNVGGGTVKCAHGVFPVPAPATVELLKARGYGFIEIDYQERETLACNVLSLGNKRLLALEENARTNAKLRAAGFDVRTFPGSELSINGGGGPTCLTRPLLRA